MILQSTAFQENDPIPQKYTCDGEDVNPQLSIDDIPDNAESLVLIVDDPDAPGKTWDHWLVFNIDPVSEIVEDSVPGKQGQNDFDKEEYGGPCPPGGTHRYFFRLYALDTTLDLDDGVSRNELEEAMQDNIVDQAELMGTYTRG